MRNSSGRMCVCVCVAVWNCACVSTGVIVADYSAGCREFSTSDRLVSDRDNWQVEKPEWAVDTRWNCSIDASVAYSGVMDASQHRRPRIRVTATARCRSRSDRLVLPPGHYYVLPPGGQAECYRRLARLKRHLAGDSTINAGCCCPV